MPWRSWSVFLLTPRVTDRSTRAAQGEAEAVHARPRLYGVHARWRSLSLVRGSHRVPEGKKISVLECSVISPDLNRFESPCAVVRIR